MDSERIIFLLKKHQNALLTSDEEQELDLLILSDPEGELVKYAMNRMLETSPAADEFDQTHWEQLSYRVLEIDKKAFINNNIPVRSHRVHFLKTAWFRFAAAVLLLLGTASYFYFITKPGKTPIIAILPATDVAPGGNKAILTLADGTQMVLDSSVNGTLASQGSTQILKLNTGSLVYQEEGRSAGKLLYNTISTRRGGQYQVMLPDGSKVWLNAASSIRFPVSFLATRSIELTGEAYMEVAQNKAIPFEVMVNGSKVEVLGTSFNINAYPEENVVRTSLIEGAVKVSIGTRSILLTPGTQATVNTAGQIEPAKKIIEDDVLAWKNGWFSFKGISLEEAMRQVERWYDVEVVYAGNIARNEKIVAGMQRDVPLNKLVRKLEMTGEIHIVMEGRKLTISR